MLDLCFFSNRTPRTNVRCFREETAQSKKAEAVQSVEMGNEREHCVLVPK